jgi:MtrB/PioB family decaheme-associated outer membrane protein
MLTHSKRTSGRATAISAASALLTFAVASTASSLAAAAEPSSGQDAVAQLTQPSNEVEMGAGAVSHGSYKFGEDNGLQNQGAFSLLNFDFGGGGTYDSNSVERWSLRGTDLGIATREVSGDFREQGKFRGDFDYEQLRHNISDLYQTPYLGAGSDFLQLPSNWLKPVVPQANATNLNYRSLSPVTGLANAVATNGQVVPPTAAQAAQVNAILAADVPDFANYNLYTNRYRWGAGFSVNLTRDWEFTAGIRQERKDGTQPLGAVVSEVNENSVTLPLHIDSVTDQYNAGFKYASQKGFFDFGYYGSVYHDNVGAISWSDPADHTRTPTLSTSPSNQFHQLNFSGGYSFARATHLAVSGSYGRGRQDEAFLRDSSMPLGLPVNSPDALVVSKVFDAKLTSRPMRRLSLSAGYKYDDEDNRTNVKQFVFYDVNIPPGAAPSAFNAALGLPAGTLSSNINIFNNRPHSRRLNQADLDADYALLPGQNIALGYRWQGIKRFCHDTWIECENAPTSNESTLRAEWRAHWLEQLTSRITYAYSSRTVDYNSNAWLALVPMANVVPAVPGATTSVYGYLTQTGLTGFGPLAGFPATPNTGNAAIFSPNNNIVPQSLYGSRDNVSELPGLRRFNVADRHQHKVRSSLDWQASDRFALDASAEFNHDEYPQSQYGLLSDESWAAHLEGTFTPSDNFEFPLFYSHEELRSNIAGDGFGSNTNAAFVGKAGNTVVAGSCYQTVLDKSLNGKLDPCLHWFTNMRERADTFGLTASRKDLRGGRLNLSGDVVYSLARTHIGVTGGSYSNNPFALAGAPALPPGTPAVFLIPGNDLPPVTTRMVEIRLRAQYALTRASQLNFLAAYQWFQSSDFAYQGMQFGSGTEQLPTNEQPFQYSVLVFGLSYVHRF